MPVPNMPSEQMRGALKALEQALYTHEQWTEMLYGTLICRMPPDERDLAVDAHRQCRFGQWFHGLGAAALAGYPGIEGIGVEHRHLHEYAATLLRSAAGGQPIVLEEYERFVSALKRLRLEIATVQHELKDALFNLDPLTGTPSRIGMLTKLRELQELVKRKVQACTIAMMDLDRFKIVNDTYGHGVGDKVLVDFARYVMEHLRPYDRLFRYGGEEFLLCLPDTELEAGRHIVDRLREGLAALPFFVEGKKAFNVTASFGVTLLDPDVPVEQTIERADRALYAAKARGRNRTVLWDASMDTPAKVG